MRLSTMFALLVMASPVVADEERPAVPVVMSSPDGVCYARSIPHDVMGNSGVTNVFRVGKDKDNLEDRYDWYSFSLYPWCWVNGQIAVVRANLWPRGHEASETQPALSFYVGGTLVREYSTLEIAGRPDNVNGSVSHYGVFEKIDGFVDFSRRPTPFVVVTADGRRLEFDPANGNELTGRLGESDHPGRSIKARTGNDQSTR